MWKQYDRTHVHTPTTTGASAHVGGLSEFSFFLVLFLRFRLQCSLVLPWFMMGPSNNTQLHTDEWRTDRGWGMVGERGNQDTTLGRPRNIRRSFWWLVILIFLVLCQTGRASYLCDHQTNQPEQEQLAAPRVWELFLVSSWSQVHRLAALASRRYCVEDDTDCSSRSWSVSIQTVVVVVPKASSVLPCPGKGGWMAMHEEVLKDDWSDSSNETRLPWIFPGTLFRSGTGIYYFTTDQ